MFSDSGVHIRLIHVEGAVAPENKVLDPRSGEGVGLNIKEE